MPGVTVTIGKTEVANLNTSNRATSSPNPYSKTLGKVNPKTLSPFKSEMYQESLGICYKVAYNITHG